MEVKLRSGRFRIQGTITENGERLEFDFPYDEGLIAEFRCMENARWHGFDDHNPRRIWSAPKTIRNLTRLKYLMYNSSDPKSTNPFERYNITLPPHSSSRPLFPHQGRGVSHVITRRHSILAYEMGTGKTLIAQEAMEWAKKKWSLTDDQFLYVGPRAALQSVEADFEEWKCTVKPRFMTYNGLVKAIEEWEGAAPRFLVLDESSKLKNHAAKRSLAAKYITDKMREEHGQECIILLMSGSPAPKSPDDWFSQTMIACPGFIREGNIKRFKERLAVFEARENAIGSSYQHRVTFRDDEKKCDKCGQEKDDYRHDMDMPKFHPFKPSKNEVALLHKRLEGLVDICFKRDVLKHLPKQIFKVIKCEVKDDLLNAARLIAKKARGAAQAIILLRELSDGFQYEYENADAVDCNVCSAKGSITEKYDPDNPEEQLSQDVLVAGKVLETRLVVCPRCNGEQVIWTQDRKVASVPCAKDDVLKEVVDDHEDVGRLVVYAGFTGSVDRCISICRNAGWHVLSVDGRGWRCFGPKDTVWSADRKEAYRQFRFDLSKKIVFIGQPGAAGMGLNLTASPTEFFYSNDYNYESRIQALARTDRPGIEATLERTNRQSIVIDCINLPTDLAIIENLNAKGRLQDITLGLINKYL